MPYLNCPRCALSVRIESDNLFIRNCPRCLARSRVAVRLYSTPAPPPMMFAREGEPEGGERPLKHE